MPATDDEVRSDEDGWIDEDDLDEDESGVPVLVDTDDDEEEVDLEDRPDAAQILEGTSPYRFCLPSPTA